MKIMLILIAALLVCVTGLGLWHGADRWAERRVIARLLDQRLTEVPRYDPAMVADQPPGVQLFFNAMLTPGVPLHRTAHLLMAGDIRLGERLIPFDGEQVLSLDHGFLWRMTTRQGMPVGGSDGDGWTRFWLAGVVPVARAGATEDHRRSAFGRRAIEAVVWTPAALLPGPGVVWAETETALTVTVTRDGLSQEMTVTLGEDGRPTRVWIDRWSDQTPDGRFGLVRMTGEVRGYIQAEGQSVASPVAVSYGDAPPFFEASIHSVRFAP